MTQVGFDILVKPLALSIDLGPICGGEVGLDPQSLIDLSQELSIEVGSSIRNRLSRETMELPYEGYEKVRYVYCGRIRIGRDEVYHFRQAIYYSKDSVVPFRFR